MAFTEFFPGVMFTRNNFFPAIPWKVDLKGRMEVVQYLKFWISYKKTFDITNPVSQLYDKSLRCRQLLFGVDISSRAFSNSKIL